MKKWIFTFTGTFLMALALNIFLEPHSLVIGGTTGIAVILLRLFNFPMEYTNIVLNLPLLLIAYKVTGRRFALNTLGATLSLSFFISITSYIPLIETDILLGSVFGGLIAGTGLGLVLKAGSTTGGTDLTAGIIKSFLPYISMSKAIFIMDVIIIGCGYFALGSLSVFYAIIAVYIISKAIDMVLGGLDFAKAAFIISSNANEIGNSITQKLKRGATLFNGMGMYSHSNKDMIIVVMASKEIPKLKEVVKEVDENSFIFITDIREIMGIFR